MGAQEKKHHNLELSHTPWGSFLNYRKAWGSFLNNWGASGRFLRNFLKDSKLPSLPGASWEAYGIFLSAFCEASGKLLLNFLGKL